MYSVRFLGDFNPAVPSHELAMSEIKYCTMDELKFDDPLDKEHPGWHAPPTRWTKLFRDLVARGMPTARVGSWDAARVVCLEWIQKLTDAERTFEHADMIIEAAQKKKKKPRPQGGWHSSPPPRPGRLTTTTPYSRSSARWYQPYTPWHTTLTCVHLQF